MALKRLGTLNGAATTLEDVYTVPASKEATAFVNACNRSAVPVTVRLAVRDGAIANDDYLWYDVPLQAAGSAGSVASIGPLPMAAGEIVTVYASGANVAWHVRGDETDVSA